MNIFRAIRQLRRSIGAPAPSDYVAPALGVLAIGMLAGAGIALLFAPVTGKKLRESMGMKLSDYRSRLMLEQGDVHPISSHRNNVKQPEPFPPRV